MTIADDYDFWRRAIAGEKQNVQENAPQCGFYKRRTHRDGPWLPVAFFMKEGKICCGFQGQFADPIDQWTYACGHPVTEEAYRAYFENGHWPDEPAPAAPRSNMPGDPFAALMAEAGDKMENARRWLNEHPEGAATDVEANYARNLQQMLAKLKAEADPMHKAEKAPWLKGGKDVDDRFRFREDLQDLATKLERQGWAPFVRSEDLRKKKEAEKENKRRAEEFANSVLDQVAARRKLFDDDPALAIITPAEPIPEQPEFVKVEKTSVGGGFGKRASVSRSYTVRIKEPMKVARHFERDPRLLQLLQKLADETAKKLKENTNIPGAVVIDDLNNVISDGTQAKEAA
jgi:hypothetical protein